VSADESGPLQKELHLLREGPVLRIGLAAGRPLEVASPDLQDELKSRLGQRIAITTPGLEALLQEGDLLQELLSIQDEVQLELKQKLT